jgi:two-component system, response regulator
MLIMLGTDYAALILIKADAQLREIPVVVLTTSSDPVDVQRYYQLGASAFIKKPVTFEGLTKAVGRMKDYWFCITFQPAHRVGISSPRN